MSLKQIEQIMKSNKTITIINRPDGEQWLSNGYACYPVRNLPKLTKENFLAILNVDEAKKDKYFISEYDSDHYENLSFLDTDPTEELIETEFLTITYKETTLRTFHGTEGLIFAAARHFKPFNDEDAEYTFYERFSKKTKGPYIAVKKGLLLDGLIMPVDFGRDEEIVKNLEHMAVPHRAFR